MLFQKALNSLAYISLVGSLVHENRFFEVTSLNWWVPRGYFKMPVLASRKTTTKALKTAKNLVQTY